MRLPMAVVLIVGACGSEGIDATVSEDAVTVAAVPRGSVWRYWDQGGDLGSSWRGEHDDASWSTGAGPLGYGEPYVVTTVSDGPITTYFRRTFTVDDPAAITSMIGEVMYDDGFVVYLNGVEIGREAMPDGTITASTLSTGYEAGNVYSTFDWTHHADVLVAGTNTIAVEVHQVSEGSSDLVFDLGLTLEAGEPSGDGAWFYWDGGGDLGTSWRTLDGPAPGWGAGDGPLGYGESYIRTPVEDGGITTYFRRTFVVDDPDEVSGILFQVMYDDGYVAYLNGHEIQRGAMPSGTITASTPSTGHEANNEYLSFDWQSYRHLLVEGGNVLAVEVHQVGESSSDLVFDARLTIETGFEQPPPQPTEDIPRQAEWFYWDDGGDLGASWRTLAGPASGWQLGEGALGYGESYIRTTTQPGPITTYFRRTFAVDDPATVAALIGEVMYDDGFVAYLNGTEIARAAMPDGDVDASTPSTGHEAGNAYATFDWTAHRDLLVAGNNVLAFEVHQASATSSDLVFDAALTVDAGESEPPPAEIARIRRGDFWKYWDHGGVPDDPGWKTDTWPTSSWGSGYGPFGYGEDYVVTPVSYGDDPARKHVTTYFWNSVTTYNPSAVTTITAEVMYDDGFVLYLNGVEVARRAMPSGAVDSTTLSTGHEAGNAYETIDLSAHAHLLQVGSNTIAVEVHQASPSSSDLVFDMSMAFLGDAPPPPPAEEDIARGSTWRYWDGASSPSGDIDFWRTPDFNDAQWETGAGPLGYGESYLATTIDSGSTTAYFRRSFTVDDPSVQTAMILELMYDDGIIVHLNGHEIVRRNMPAGSTGHGTLATEWREAGNTYEVLDVSDFVGHLVDGSNVIAVEVHQNDPGSSDLVFDLALQLDTPPVCAVPGGGPGVPPEPHDALNDVWVGPASVFVVGSDGAIGRRGDDGAWCWAVLEEDVTWSAVWGTADDDVWIVGGGGRVLHFDGASFTPVDVGTTAFLTAIGGTGPDDVWIVGVEGTIRHFDGAAWTAHDLPADQTLQAVWAATTDDVWVSGHEPAPYPGDSDYDGTSAVIYRWAPATASWTLEVKDTTYYGYADFRGLDGTGPDDVWAVGADQPAGSACTWSGARRYDGASWASPDAPVGCRGFKDVAAGAPGAEDGAWIVGSVEGEAAGGAVRYTGGAWDESVPSPNGFTAIDHEGDRMWAVGRAWWYGARQFIVRWDGAAFVEEW